MRSLAYPSPEDLGRVISETVEEEKHERGAGQGRAAAELLAWCLESGSCCPLLLVTCIV